MIDPAKRWNLCFGEFTSFHNAVLSHSFFCSHLFSHKNLAEPFIPIGSMYGIYGNIYHQYTPNVSIYTIHGSYGIVHFATHKGTHFFRRRLDTALKWGEQPNHGWMDVPASFTEWDCFFFVSADWQLVKTDVSCFFLHWCFALWNQICWYWPFWHSYHIRSFQSPVPVLFGTWSTWYIMCLDRDLQRDLYRIVSPTHLHSSSLSLSLVRDFCKLRLISYVLAIFKVFIGWTIKHGI